MIASHLTRLPRQRSLPLLASAHRLNSAANLYNINSKGSNAHDSSFSINANGKKLDARGSSFSILRLARMPAREVSSHTLIHTPHSSLNLSLQRSFLLIASFLQSASLLFLASLSLPSWGSLWHSFHLLILSSSLKLLLSLRRPSSQSSLSLRRFSLSSVFPQSHLSFQKLTSAVTFLLSFLLYSATPSSTLHCWCAPSTDSDAPSNVEILTESVSCSIAEAEALTTLSLLATFECRYFQNRLRGLDELLVRNAESALSRACDALHNSTISLKLPLFHLQLVSGPNDSIDYQGVLVSRASGNNRSSTLLRAKVKHDDAAFDVRHIDGFLIPSGYFKVFRSADTNRRGTLDNITDQFPYQKWSLRQLRALFSDPTYLVAVRLSAADLATLKDVSHEMAHNSISKNLLSLEPVESIGTNTSASPTHRAASGAFWFQRSPGVALIGGTNPSSNLSADSKADIGASVVVLMPISTIFNRLDSLLQVDPEPALNSSGGCVSGVRIKDILQICLATN